MTRISSVLLAFLASGLVSSVSAAGEDPARRAVDSARELYSSGNWETAVEAYEEALRLAPKGSVGEAEALIELASLRWEQGDYAGAHKQATQALTAAKKLKLDQAVGRLMLTLGHIEASQGRFGQAEGTLQICVKSAEQQHDAIFTALCNINLRFVRQLRGKSVGSEKAYRGDLDTLKRSGESVLVGTALAKSAELQEKAQDFEGALNTLRQAEAQFEAAGSLPSISRNKLRLTQAYQSLNRWDEAAKELDGLVLTFQNMKNRPSLVTAYALRGKQLAHEGKGKSALKDYFKARATAQDLGSPQLVANSEIALCEYFALTNDGEATEKYCASAGATFSKIGIPSLAARAYILRARLAQSQKEWLSARSNYLEALRILSEDVSASSRDKREISVQQVNLCQVELQLKSNGAHRRCLDAGSALKTVKASDASFRGMIAATDYAIGMTTPEKQRDDAMKAFESAAEGWLVLNNGPQAAEALLRLGKLQSESKRTRKESVETLDRGLKALGVTANAQGQALEIQLLIQKGQAQLALEMWDPARVSLERLVDQASATSDNYSAAWGCSGLAQARLKLKDRSGAIDALRKGQAFAKKSNDDELLQLIENNLSKLGGS